MANVDDLAPNIFLLPQDALRKFSDPELAEAQKTLIKFHKKYYDVDLTQLTEEERHKDHYGIVKKGFRFTMRQKMQRVLKALLIFNKYEPDTDLCAYSAEILVGGLETKEKATKEELLILEENGWTWSEEFECYRIFT